MRGLGVPLAGHGIVILLFSSTLTSRGMSSGMCGGSVITASYTIILCMLIKILGDNPLETTPPETTLTENTPRDKPPPRLGVLTLTDPRRGVPTLTLTLTDPRGGNYLKTDTNPYS